MLCENTAMFICIATEALAKFRCMKVMTLMKCNAYLAGRLWGNEVMLVFGLKFPVAIQQFLKFATNYVLLSVSFERTIFKLDK